MKFAFFVAVSLTLLACSRVDSAWGIELFEDVPQSDAIVSPTSIATDVFSTSPVSSAERDDSGVGDEYNVVGVPAATHWAEGAIDSADKHTAPAPGKVSIINAVPEPSALLLALAALVYFLLFGRRRTIV